MRQTQTAGPMRIDLRAVIHSKMGRRARWVPRLLPWVLERLICAGRLNVILATAWPRRGAEFCRSALEQMEVRVRLADAANLPPASSRPLIVSNHPLGGLDGLALIQLMTDHYGPDVPVHFVVNDLLMAVEPLGDVFVPVNKHGGQSRGEASRLEEVMAADGVVLMFPAGLCSRRGADGSVADLVWQKMFVNRAIKYRRTVVPVHFGGSNSRFFYNFARLRRRLGLRFNLEMLLLPRQMFGQRGRTLTVTCGRPVEASALVGGTAAAATAAAVRQRVYDLVNNKTDN